MWNCDPSVSIKGTLNADAIYEPEDSFRSRAHVHGFPGWRLMTYLPLVEEGYYLYGLTAFCSLSGGITGFKAYFRGNQSRKDLLSHSVGWCQGCRIHFRMMSTERITSVCIRRGRLTISNPYLLVCLVTPNSTQIYVDTAHLVLACRSLLMSLRLW